MPPDATSRSAQSSNLSLPTDAGTILLPLARSSIAAQLAIGAPLETDAPWLRAPGASFVTLMLAGQLRGCIGSLEAERALGDDVKANAVAAAFRDPRFAPLSASELATVEVEVSVLTRPTALDFYDENDALAKLRPGVDGVIFEYGHHRSTFLPQVWEDLPDRHVFMTQLKRKAGLPPDFWDPGARLATYEVTKWREADLRKEVS
jgi:AmmeMemoRadiSam system protein A